MRKRFTIRELFRLMCVGGIVVGSTNILASGFQLFEQDGASVGNYHAGRSAELNDASAVFYNPAGITRIQNQQIVVGDVGILSNIKFRGTIATALNGPGVPPIGTQNATSQAGSFSQVPNFYYVAPLTPNVGIGIGLNAPFGLRTDYGRDTATRYVTTKSEIQVVDLTPAIGFNLTKKLSLGIGLDVQRMGAELDQMATVGTDTDTYGTNKGWSTAYGYHVGALFQFLPTTRVGLTYNSQVVHHIRGTSRFVGPIATLLNFGTSSTIYSGTANAHVTLPAYTTLSAFHKVNEKWAIMGTAMYTQWSVIQNLTLQNVAGAIFAPFPVPAPSSTITIILPTHYRNTWNVSVGANYYATDKFTLRGGVGYDQTPVRNTYRELRIPDDNRYALALGGHYQATKALGFDLGWTHLFMVGNVGVNPPPSIVGGARATTHGNVEASADVFGGQVTWDIA
jgi:long-chain fatty acid transport protein